MASQCVWLVCPSRLRSGGPPTVPAEPHPVSSAGSHPAPGTSSAGPPPPREHPGLGLSLPHARCPRKRPQGPGLDGTHAVLGTGRPTA